jgi:hypothetical protein
MITPQKLLEDFTKEIVASPGSRPELIAGYAATLQSRDDAIRREYLQSKIATLRYIKEGQNWEHLDDYLYNTIAALETQLKPTNPQP